jgi:hypothetical protein
MNPYNQLMNPAQTGQHLMQSFQAGGQQRREMETQNALSQYAQNPQDPKAKQALARWNPQLSMQLQQREQEMALKGLEAHREKIIMGAQIVRQIQPKDEAGWQQVRAMAQQVGIDLADVPPNFDPQYVQGLISVADAFEPQKQQGTAMQQNYEFLQGQDPQLAQSYLKNQAEGAPLIASNGDGTFTIIPRNMAQGPQGGPQPGTVEDGFRFKGGNPADPNSWEPVNGGQTPQASGGFPGN